MADNTLEAAVQGAMDTVEKPEGLENAIPPQPKKEVKKEDEAKVENEETEESDESKEVEDLTDLSEIEAAQAKELFKALKNPQTAGTVIDLLARQAGYSRAEIKKDPEGVKEDIKTQLEAALGDDLKFLAERIGPVIDKAIDARVDKIVEDKTRSIKETLKQQEDARVKDASVTAMQNLSKQFYDGKDIPTNVLNKMNQLMDENDPSPKITIERYIQKIHNEACGELNIRRTSNGSNTTKKTANDVPSRLASERTGTPAKPIPDSKPITVNEAVRLAMEQVAEQMEK